jgi:hypothetical protein
MTYRNTNTQDGGLAPPNRFPIKYEINGQNLKNLPSTGNFGATFGRPSTAASLPEAIAKAKQQASRVAPGLNFAGVSFRRNTPIGSFYEVAYQSSGGKRKNKTSHRHRSTRRKSMRRTTRRRRG